MMIARALLLLALTTTPAKADDRADVLAAVDRFLNALNTNDAEAYAAAQVNDGVTYSQRYAADGSAKLRRRSNHDNLEMLRADSTKVREQYWNPTVLVHKDIAIVWAPYSFDIDGKRSHCGIDAFDLLRVDGVWKIGNAMWTVEPDGCAK